jgi:hypothetical protein
MQIAIDGTAKGRTYFVRLYVPLLGLGPLSPLYTQTSPNPNGLNPDVTDSQSEGTVWGADRDSCVSKLGLISSRL